MRHTTHDTRTPQSFVGDDAASEKFLAAAAKARRSQRHDAGARCRDIEIHAQYSSLVGIALL